jgi:hypothetical protein
VLAIIRKRPPRPAQARATGSAMTKSACCGSPAAASVTFRGAAERRDSCRPFWFLSSPSVP